MITEQKIIEGLRALPQHKKDILVAQATIHGIDIEKQLVPTLTNVLRGAEMVASWYFKNRRFLA